MIEHKDYIVNENGTLIEYFDNEDLKDDDFYVNDTGTMIRKNVENKTDANKNGTMEEQLEKDNEEN